jgi:predicted ribosome quality control (RQC) complex YloA/Tae2 family protein
MVDTYFFIRQLAAELSPKLSGKKLLECFSQSKDEILLGFASEQESFWLKAGFLPQFCLLAFPEDFQRAKKNTIDLLPELINKTVSKVEVFENERAFRIEFEQGYDLVFKLFGNKSNLILFQDQKPVVLFRKKFVQDLSLDWAKLHRKLEAQPFVKSPLLNKQMRLYLEQHPDHSIEAESLAPKGYFLTSCEKNPELWLFKPKNQTIDFQTNTAISAAQLFYEHFIRVHHFLALKTSTLQQLNQQITRNQSFVSQGYLRLQELKSENPHEKAADLLMAYLNEVQEGSSEVHLPDFQTNESIKIKLNDKLSPQKNAENLYKKAKNRRLEIESLEKGIELKQAKLEILEKHRQEVIRLEDFFSLNKYLKHELSEVRSEESESQPFRVLSMLGFTIYVGKNAKHNDKLLKMASKDDLWLHVRDAKGCHVLVKKQPGQTFPKPVIERAAELAAHYSERRNDSLCAVIFTPKKFVRKRKGSQAGEVVVDKEQVVLVWPKGLPEE